MQILYLLEKIGLGFPEEKNISLKLINVNCVKIENK